MINCLKDLKQEAKKLAAARKQPPFIEVCKMELEQSRQHFFDNPLILNLQQECLPLLYDDTGFGIEHAKHTAIDAGALALKDYSGPQYDTRRLVLGAQVAGMLHDICRTEGEHAERGALIAEMKLSRYDVEPELIKNVKDAVSRHEDIEADEPVDEASAAVSACLYDADKFRWGPDFFTTFFWEMTDYLTDPPETFPEAFKLSVESLPGYLSTFRTSAGKRFGNAYIEFGMDFAPKVQPLLKRIKEQARTKGDGCPS
jgi:hypothetical protein